MDTHCTGGWFERLRPLIAAFLVFALGMLSQVVMADPATCDNEAAALAKCNSIRDGYRAYQTVTPCTATLSADKTTGVYSFQYSNSTWSAPGTGGQSGFNVCQPVKDPDPPPDLCASAASFTGWMDFNGNSPGVSCKEGCAYSATDGESGAGPDGTQRYVGTFTSMGRSCTASESTASGTPAIGDPPADDGSGHGSDPGTGTDPAGSSSSGGTGTGGNPAGSSSSGGTGTGTGSNPAGSSSSGGNGTGTGTGGNGTGTGGNGTGGNGTGGNGTGTGTGTGTNPAGSSSSGGKDDNGSYSGDSCDAPPNCTGDAVMCGVANETHKSRCAVEKAFSADDDLPTAGKDLSQADLIGPDVDVGKDFTPDQTGFGLDSTCPFKAMDAGDEDMKFSVDLSFVCDHVVAMRAWLMALAAVACYLVMVGKGGGRVM